MSPAPRIAWEQFTLDPRRPENAAMRASDKDRDVALSALAEAFADGRLDREELDERSTRVQATKHLGELVGPLADLAAAEPVPAVVGRRPLERASEGDLQRRAEQRYAQARAAAWRSFLVPSLVCWTIWLVGIVAAGPGAAFFPWPLFVMLGTGPRLVRLLTTDRATMVEHERRHLVEHDRREARRELRDLQREEHHRRRADRLQRRLDDVERRGA